uniref:Uncharacterized protein n=1 Tax=Arundo donax TaxID=35708 RepID=A0A0A9GPI0_ARUDO
MLILGMRRDLGEVNSASMNRLLDPDEGGVGDVSLGGLGAGVGLGYDAGDGSPIFGPPIERLEDFFLGSYSGATYFPFFLADASSANSSTDFFRVVVSTTSGRGGFKTNPDRSCSN